MDIIKLNPGGANCYLIKGSEGYLLIDTGMKGAAVKIRRQIRAYDIKPDQINHILITHDHYDHTGGLEELKEMTEAQVIIHADELKDNSKNKNQSNWLFRVLVKVIGAITPEGKPEAKIQPDVMIDGDLDLHEWGYSARIIHTPGHSPGSVCVVTDDGQCIAGDTLFNMFPRSHYPIIVYDRKKLADSYRRLEKEDCTVYHPGHGESITKENFQKRILNKGKYMKD